MTKRYFVFVIILMVLAVALIVVTFYIKNSKIEEPAPVVKETSFDVAGLVPFDQWKTTR
jgi:uncharacterized protein YxeA